MNQYRGRWRPNCYISVDATNCHVKEPSPFDTRLYSHKFKGSGLRYEVGICISTGHIVWINGPFPCGEHSDVKIFKAGMKLCLDDNEYVVADGGHSDARCRKFGNMQSQTRFFGIVRARAETVSSRLKKCDVLSQTFRHSLCLHSSCFNAVANIAQVVLENSEGLFQV